MAVLTAVAPQRSAFVAPVESSGTVTLRKSVYALTPDEVTQYRLAVYRLAQISQQVTTDQRGYQWIAGLHGAPNYYCHRVQPAFALWHRPYIQQYEQRLQDVVEDAFVPYWDWTTHQAQEQGIPDIFTAQTWTNPDTNAQEPNPLLTQPQTLIGRGSTARQPQDPANLVPLRAMVHDAMFAPDYVSFSTDLENPHNSLHMWVGGDMGNIAYAAYDPLFWSHHAFVEYVFCQWQDAHPNATRPPLSQQDLAPFSVTLDQIWDYKNLGYAYVPDNASPLTLSGVSAGPGAAAGNTLRSRATVAHFPLYTIDPEDIRRAEVVFDGLRRPEESLAVRIFADNDDATAQTPLDDPSYLGTRFFFGHGECSGAEGHCDPIPRDIYDLRPPHHYAPRQVRVNITKPLKRLIALRGDPDAKDASITLVAVDAAGNAIDDADLYFEGLSVVVR